MIKTTIINNETGEILNDNFIIDELEDIQRKKKVIEKKKLNEEFKNLQQEHLGYFVFFIYKNMDTLTNVLSDAELVKFIYIGTYVKSNGILMLDNNITYVNKQMLRKLLNVNDKTFRNFYNKLIDNELLLDEDNKLYINLNYFYRGKESTYKKLNDIKLDTFTRIYIETTRNLYNTYEAKNHRKLALVYKLIPFVNWKYNILCNDPNEIDKTKIKILTLNDIMKYLGYNKSNITRFTKDFYNLKYNDYYIFKSVTGAEGYLNSIIIVNPLVLYKGNDIKELEYLITLFELKTTI